MIQANFIFIVTYFVLEELAPNPNPQHRCMITCLLKVVSFVDNVCTLNYELTDSDLSVTESEFESEGEISQKKKKTSEPLTYRTCYP